MISHDSIHYRQRWFYALWVTLLLMSCWALFLWERPLRFEQASLAVKVQIRNAPTGTQVQVWAGPWSRWEGLRWSGEEGGRTPLQADGSASLPLLRIQIARRRWLQGYVPRGTWDLVMLRFTAPSRPPRYLAVPLSEDIRQGVLRPKWRLTTSIGKSWEGLQTDGKAPAEKP
jgi:hypothetical protein